jgi:hypothetical protein
MSNDSAARLIVCEPTPRWAVLMRRFASELQVSEARSLALADDMLRDSSASGVAVAVSDANAANVLLKLSDWQRDYPDTTAAVLLDESNAELELGLREVGAQLVIVSLFELPMLARFVKRQHKHGSPTR